MYDLSLQQASAIKPITSPQPNTSSLGSCIKYNPSTRTITVSCSSPARLTDIDNKLHDASILVKQSPDGVWFLGANLVIAKGATFHIDSTDTRWLKISSMVTRVPGIAKITPAYIIDVHGSLKIDSVKNSCYLKRVWCYCVWFQSYLSQFLTVITSFIEESSYIRFQSYLSQFLTFFGEKTGEQAAQFQSYLRQFLTS